MIEHFLKETKPAIRYQKHFRLCEKSFPELYQDIYKMIGFFQKKQLKPKDKVGLLILPYTYEFYVVMLAGMLYQLNIVIFDSYKKRHIEELMQLEEVRYCFVDTKTRYIARFLVPFCKRLAVSGYSSCLPGSIQDFNVNQTILTTFTSGTTRTPKAIYRSFAFLKQQAEEIQNEVNLDSIDSVFGGLPIYNLLSIWLLKTTCVSKRIKNIPKFHPDCVLTNIQKILKEKRSFPAISRVMLGGAILYSWETAKIKSVFPNAQITYVYGASEGAMIYKTDLEFYCKNLFTFDTPATQIQVRIKQMNQEGVGEIVIEGDNVNTFNHIHHTGDLGKLVDGKLMVVGRKKYSSIEQEIYNYCLDEDIRKENKILAFSFQYKSNLYVVYKGKLKQKKDSIKYISMHKLPMDLKHKTKLDYKECIRRIEKTGKAV